jgi:hypothetical protein
MIWIQKDRIPAGRWPFLNTVRVSLNIIEEHLEPDIDITEGAGGITITGCIRAYRQTVMRRTLDLAQSAVISWNGGFVIGACVCARSLFETIAIYYTFLTRAEAYAKDRRWEEIGALVDAHALFSSKRPTETAHSEFRPPRVSNAAKEFITGTSLGNEIYWDQICEVAHPNGATMMKYAGDLKEQHLVIRNPSATSRYFFPLIYNALYSCCWLRSSDLDLDILLAVMREGKELPPDHPLIEEKRSLNEVTAKVLKDLQSARKAAVRRQLRLENLA